MATIKAIETAYGGYRFRSRLEARWAVFLDTLGVAYEYEPEGFELGNGERYLPDFWIPDWHAFVEIKGQISVDAFDRAHHLAQGSGRAVLLIVGPPGPIGSYAIGLFRPGEFIAAEGRFAACRRCEGICLHWGEEIVMTIGSHACGDQWNGCITGREGAPRLYDAYDAARRARFEFGERGR